MLQEFLDCFKDLKDTDDHKKREEYFRLYSQLYYVIQRNTKEEVMQVLLPRVRFPQPSSCTSSAPSRVSMSTSATVPMPQRVYIAEKNSVFGRNEEILQQMQATVATLSNEIDALVEQKKVVDEEIDQLTHAVQDAQDALVPAFEHRQ